MVKKGNKKIGIVATPEDMRILDVLMEKTDLHITQIYRLALRDYYRNLGKD